MTAVLNVVFDMPSEIYQADPLPGGSLSSSGARKLLPPHCPAKFDHERRHGRPDTRAFDMGHAAHKLVLGAGPDIVSVDADSWRTNAAKAQAEEVRAAGGVPLLAADFTTVTAMADALREHPIASALFEPGSGHPEVSMFWTDEQTGVNLRARPDWLPDPRGDGRVIIPDYKSAVSAEPDKFAKTAADFGYHQQAAWYCDGVTALDLGDDPLFVFVVQEKTPPYLITVIQLDAEALRIGRALNRQAIDLYAECDRTGVWPGYHDDVAIASLPYYYARKFEGATV